MHKVEIAPWVVERVIAKRGAEHVYEDFDPKKTALIVIDLQNAFMLPGAAFVVVETAAEIVPNVNRLAAGLRAAGGKVVWIAMTYTDQVTVDWSAFYRLMTVEGATNHDRALTRGTKGHEIWDGLDVQPADTVIEKSRFSALVQGSSELDNWLRAHDITTLIITGCLTDVCCESTARDGMMLNYEVIMVTDANAAPTDADHNAALSAFYTTFGDILSTDRLVELLEQKSV
ncbi:isochorismatase family protein [Antrihabitans sp. YC2-6]|uniref:isochorismatase family protein n=1 Tax=Antrihabitans sp. YC2-6 TaxID=2799498 RepID=UPI0018F507FC|nr:isochorismatase family cysteine hydrolase [Antrihabitans sp. YC2-6]MBJ8344384.1 cysteine hydrolase [Antrihabitans sp. YC2-6]